MAFQEIWDARLRLQLAFLVTAILAAGCFGDPAKPIPSDEQLPATPALRHPEPNPPGVDWPAGLEGPFELASLTNIKIPALGGIKLDGWLLRPAVPEGVKVPVVLWAAPYFGLNNLAGDNPDGWDNSDLSEAVPVNLLVEEGYAVAIVNLRGSGNSEGCYQFFGSTDWKDVAAMVEWLGTQDWSNGRVGAMGLSYHGTTPWMAAVEAPPHLKTIVTAGQITSLYTFSYTPQGAHLATGPSFWTRVNTFNVAPPVRGTPTELASDWPPTLASKLCPELIPIYTESWSSAYTDMRDAAFWNDRDLLPHYKDIQASVFLTMGFQDFHGSGHATQEDYAWANLPADVPKRMLVGQWGHMFPNFAERYVESGRDWNAELLGWLDYWLKGIGDAAALKLGVVEYQDSADRWHTSDAWPPTNATPRALYLGDGTLDASAAAGERTFLPRPQVPYYQDLCMPQASPPAILLYQTEPFAEEVVIAGNPFALLELEADRPGGQVAVFLIAIDDRGVKCGELVVLGDFSFRFLGMGAADLRHYAGNYVGTDFPVGTPTQVRIDINNFAEVLAPGERLGLVMAYGDATYDGANEYNPIITVHEGRSHLVVPLVSGSMPASAAWAEYPPRPFDPMGGDP